MSTLLLLLILDPSLLVSETYQSEMTTCNLECWLYDVFLVKQALLGNFRDLRVKK